MKIIFQDNSIVDLQEHPIKTSKREWLFDHRGRTSLAMKINPQNQDEVMILAYSDETSGAIEIDKIAKKHNLHIIHNIPYSSPNIFSFPIA